MAGQAETYPDVVRRLQTHTGADYLVRPVGVIGDDSLEHAIVTNFGTAPVEIHIGALSDE